MKVDDSWAGQERAMYNFESLAVWQLRNPSESRVELEKQRDELKLEMACLDKMGPFAEQDERNTKV